MDYLIFINALIFFLLGILHLYWAFGGRKIFLAALPTTTDRKLLFQPKAASSIVVGIGLFIFSLITLGNYGIYDALVSERFFQYATLAISMIFFARAIGDFKYMGLSKTIRHTSFAKNDTRIFIPLCLVLAFSG